FAEGNYLRAAKVFGSAMVSDSVYVKHMLFQGSDAANLADSLLNVLRHGGDFSSLAALYSDDKNSAVDGQFGNLGWMTQTYILPGFESIITAKIGEPYVLETRYGTHIVEVVKATKPVLKKQVAILEKSTIASNETYNTFYSQANSFATLANGKLEGFRKAADSLKVYVHPVDGVTESTSNYGPIDQAKEVTRWAFDAKKGSVSNVIKVNNNYFFVAALREIHKEGITPLEDMSQAIERVLYAKAVAQKENESVKEKIQGLGSLEEIATALNTTVSTDQSIVASAMGSATTDPALAGAVSVSKEGKICGPVSGSMGTYVFVVNGHDTAAFYTESDAKSLAQRKGQYVAQQIVPVMMMDNDVVDNRARFF
ncbi:MAG: peptidyl-prolyl cis-trans isomerase, partial [Bacteroidales bacterium]|nr:peptidyl-prolyl cis-trans isomerase [Bacteroidales bacterium]